MLVDIRVAAPRERVWDMTIEQFGTTHGGVCTNHSTVFSHMILIDGKIQIFSLSRERIWTMSWNTVQIKVARNKGCKSLAIAIADIMTGFTWLIKYLGNKLPPCPKPFPLVQNRVWPHETTHHMHPNGLSVFAVDTYRFAGGMLMFTPSPMHKQNTRHI